ncbi:MAG: fibronectin type III domain-containing protein [Desulfobulbaceae bacterium]|nr:fibronectin type III domain-containing protein [Desulfobulbaceae bacterium]HIJ79780.1 fibronectin type III domain-containing protein [Deltaproteobacteria bacterium]
MMGQSGATVNRCLILLALASLLVLGACGKKTRPVPPDTVLPAPITDLRAKLDEKGVTLTWSFPTRTVQGERLPYRLDGFRLLRAVVAEKDYCAGCPVTFGPAIDIKGESGAEGEVTYRETLLRPQHRYVYRVQSRAGWFVASADSNPVAVGWDTPLQAPRELAAEEGDQLLTLTWQPPAGLLDGTEVTDPVHYQILRSLNGEVFAEYGELVDGLSFVDRNVRNSTRYFYKIRAVRLHHETKAGGMATEPVVASPRDLQPPVPPQHVAVTAIEQGVKIYWEAVPETDLAGFHIYRRDPAKDKAEHVGEVGGASLSFIDKNLPNSSATWYYSVTAFDRARPANESSPSMEAIFEARKP